MNYRLQHTGTYQLSSEHWSSAEASHTVRHLPDPNQVARKAPTTATPFASAKAPRPVFNQYQSVGFVSLSDRIASQTEDYSRSSNTAPATASSSVNSKSSFATARISALWQNLQRWALPTLLALLAGVFVYVFVTG